ncbi:rod shape-determining protein MreC [Anaerocolumna aminovalerica]|jgi:rod shape-determining protein MreC|uniref:Cell shape-determining protein MreC n=2 Tax=Anaerocolumna aminovalerica TaxID=1527 RepID=A0A1I5CIW9_9FIRM|nr:rod shape-determining protein MreC [Anaerocolumna aminovalerica]MBU5332607.1 rod shape-determining protein MreC [Anaerocolumna aminovalerica]SFN86960.1 rod shape-determining protein MreC [Anaerocolumna aminovalerica]
MRRRTKLNLNPKHVFIAVAILCFALMFLSYQFGDELSPIKTVVGDVISPMQKGINTVGHGLFNQFEKIASFNKLLDENTRLKEELNVLSYENKILLQDKYELDRFRDLYKLDKKYADYPKVAARVIAADPNNGFSTFQIDKGSDDGITVDMNVIAGNGLVGIVESVGKNYATIRSVIDDSSSVYGMFLKTSDTCVVRGDLEKLEKGVIGVEMIKKEADIQDGYEVVTSNISDKYLQGILIGYISNITVDSNNLSKTADLTPAVDFEHLEEVLIITEVKEKLE